MKSASPIRAAGWISTPGQHAARVGDGVRHDRHARLVHRVRDAVGQQRLDAAVGEEDLEPADSARRGVALLRGGQVLAQLAA